MLGTESWLTDNIHSKEIFPDFLGFKIIRRDRKVDQHGGVIIAAHDLGLTQSFCSNKTELISGNIKIGPRKSISLNCFYRPPNKQDQEYMYIDTALAELKNLREKNKNISYKSYGKLATANSKHTPRLKEPKTLKIGNDTNSSKQSYRKNPGLLMENTWKISSAQSTRSSQNASGPTSRAGNKNQQAL
ncbi:unnamed protein product [Mytilus coruscus]|uniref:Uncharacterized protein n=1 Tax=Mytilus coruscus TaxID=42192 RepID=A0A6J8C3I4_MYTCO|nr:unnamed protein product [Mytilus coruscus]